MKPTTSIQAGELQVQEMVRKVLLVCGILSSLLYVAIDIIAAMKWEEYSHASQTVSELIAINAPSRQLAVPLFLTYSILIIAFGLGVWRSAGRKRALRVAACQMVFLTNTTVVTT